MERNTVLEANSVTKNDNDNDNSDIEEKPSNQNDLGFPPLVLDDDEQTRAREYDAHHPQRSSYLPATRERVLRMTLSVFIAYTLAIIHNNNNNNDDDEYNSSSIFPPSQQWLIGLLGSLVILQLPNNYRMATAGATLILGYALVLFGLVGSTFVLLWVSVSDGWMVASATLWAFWVSTSLKYPSSSSTITTNTATAKAIISNFIFVDPGCSLSLWLVMTTFSLIGLGLHRVVRDGLTISVPSELLEASYNQDNDDDDGFVQLFNMSPTGLEEVVEFAIGILPQIVAAAETGVDVVIAPEVSEIFAGQTVHLEIEGSTDALMIQMQGGLWLLRGFWTWSGSEKNNSLAVMSNFFIVFSWSFLPVLLVSCLPPWRTTRHQLASITLPQTLLNTAQYIDATATAARNTTSVSSHGINSRQQRRDLLRLYQIIAQEAPLEASLTAFEPRFLDCRFRWPRGTFQPLATLTKAVEQHLLKALMSDCFPLQSNVARSISERYREIAQSLMVKARPPIIVHQTTDQSSGDEDQPISIADDPLWHVESSHELNELSMDYIEAMCPTKTLTCYERMYHLALVTLPYLTPTFALFLRLFIDLPLHGYRLLVGSNRVDWAKAAHHVKFAMGVASLLIVSIDRDEYRAFEVESNQTSESGVTIIHGSPLGSFSFWHIVVYCFATMPTSEGTVKRGLFGLVGTLLGAFSAWIAIRAMGESHVGFIAWLTITSLFFFYVSIEKVELLQRPRLHSAGFFIIMTQSVICMEHLTGLKFRDELVLNRIVSNIAGIVAAVVLALIPPKVMGSDAKWTRLVVTETRRALKETLRHLLQEQESTESILQIRERFSRTSESLRENALYLLKDAKRSDRFSFLRVDDYLEETLSEVGITSSFLDLLLMRAHQLRHDTKPNTGCSSEEFHEQLRFILVHVETGKQFVEPQESLTITNKFAVVINGLQVVQQRLVEHETQLVGVKKGTLLGRVIQYED